MVQLLPYRTTIGEVRRKLVLLLFTGSMLATAQALPPTEMEKAQQELSKIRDLVKAGALPRMRLEEAEFKIEDAKDDTILRQTLFGNMTVEHLTSKQADEMIAAAERRVARQQSKVDRMQGMVESGVLARGDVDPLKEELNLRHQTLSLAFSRAELLAELGKMAQAERDFAVDTTPYPTSGGPTMVRFFGSGNFNESILGRIELAYNKTFHHDLPISAHGETATHRALGFDHRGRVDVALNPDQKEGLWLRSYLESAKIPYYAFRGAMVGKATGPHIHIGPPSQRLTSGD